MHRAAVLWWAASTRSVGAVGVLALASTVPLVVASPFVGALADRRSRRGLMVSADVARVGTSLGLAAAIVTPGAPLAALAALTAVAALAEAVFATAFAASVSQLLPEDERAAGNALNLANSAAGGMLGPVLGGLGVAAAGPARVLAVDAASFLVSAVVVGTTAIRRPASAPASGTVPTPGPTDRASDRGDRSSGWAIVTRHPELRRLTALASVLNLCTGPTAVLLAALVTQRLRRGPAVYGLLDACVAAGILGGVAIVPTLARRAPSRGLVTGLVAVGVAFVGVGLVPSPVWSGAAFVVVGVGVALANSFLPARFQALVPEDRQGRVFGVVGGLAAGLRPLGLALAGPLVATVGPAGGYAVCGAGIVATTLALRPRDAGVVGRPPAAEAYRAR